MDWDSDSVTVGIRTTHVSTYGNCWINNKDVLHSCLQYFHFYWRSSIYCILKLMIHEYHQYPRNMIIFPIFLWLNLCFKNVSLLTVWLALDHWTVGIHHCWSETVTITVTTAYLIVCLLFCRIVWMFRGLLQQTPFSIPLRIGRSSTLKNDVSNQILMSQIFSWSKLIVTWCPSQPVNINPQKQCQTFLNGHDKETQSLYCQCIVAGVDTCK